MLYQLSSNDFLGSQLKLYLNVPVRRSRVLLFQLERTIVQLPSISHHPAEHTMINRLTFHYGHQSTEISKFPQIFYGEYINFKS